MKNSHSLCSRYLRFIVLLSVLYPISSLSIQVFGKSDRNNISLASVRQTSGILRAEKMNPTTVDVLFANNQRMIIDFYGENIFRVFQDNSGGVIRDPEAKPAVLCGASAACCRRPRAGRTPVRPRRRADIVRSTCSVPPVCAAPVAGGKLS